MDKYRLSLARSRVYAEVGAYKGTQYKISGIADHLLPDSFGM